jgi:REP element-mobilizing transposase RayT
MSAQHVPYPIYALAVMHDHTHIVLGRIERDIRRAIGHMKSEATRLLRVNGHFPDRSPWADHGWNVYLDSNEDVRCSIEYVNRNPVRKGLAPQNWKCVRAYKPYSQDRNARCKHRC